MSAKPTPIGPTPDSVAPTKPRTITQWTAFAQAKLIPVRVDCQAYPIPGQPWIDLSCHTRLLPSPDTFKRHMEAEHGGAIQVYVKRTEGKAHPLWEALQTSGLEAVDMRCEICDAKVRPHPASLEQHLRPHKGKSRQAYNEMRLREPQAVGLLNITFGVSAPPIADDDPDPEE